MTETIPTWVQLVIDLRWTAPLLMLLWFVLSVALKPAKKPRVISWNEFHTPLSCGFPGSCSCKED